MYPFASGHRYGSAARRSNGPDTLFQAANSAIAPVLGTPGWTRTSDLLLRKEMTALFGVFGLRTVTSNVPNLIPIAADTIHRFHHVSQWYALLF